jgi:putative ABC transport system permease protein
MITSIFKQIWNQKRKNAFIAVEMFFLFALIFAGGFHLADKLTTYFIPENYESQNRISLVIWSGNDNSEHQKEDMDRLTKTLSAIDDVILAGKAFDGPFGGSYTNSSIYVDSLQIGAEFRGGDPNLAEVLGFDVIEGQWFDQASLNLYASVYPFEKNMSKEQAAEATAHVPIVVDRLLAEKISETGDALHQKILIDNRSCEVIGIIEPIKREGFRKPEPAVYLPTDWRAHPSQIELFIQYRPNANLPVLMEQINHRIFTILDKESWQISTLATLDSLKARETEMERVDLIYIVFLAMFLIFTALLGLTGIFSFNINKRKPEIGVLRAIGSSQSHLQGRLVMEMLFISLLGILPAIFFLAQIPMLDIFPIEAGFYFRTLAGTFVFLVVLIILFAWYPAYNASRMEPALALKDE